MDLNLALPVFAVAFISSVGLIGFCITLFSISINSRYRKFSGGEPIIIQAVLNKDDVEFPHMRSPFIAMPGNLGTRNEMVAWMTGELPRLTVDLMRSKT